MLSESVSGDSPPPMESTFLGDSPAPGGGGEGALWGLFLGLLIPS